MWQRLSPWLALGTALVVPAGAANQPPAPSSLGITAANAAVPFLLENGLVYLAGSLGGSTQLAFVVDTGSTATSLDPKVAQAAGIDPVGTTPLLVARRDFPQQKFSIASTDYITAISGRPTAGVLGQPQFTRYSLALDFDRNRAALLSPEICPSTATRLPIFTAGELPFVEGSIPLPNGQQATGLFLVDTGQPGPGIVLAASFIAAHPGLAAGVKVQREDGSTLVRLPELRLGALTLHAPIAELDKSATTAGNPRLAGVLGLEALRRFNLVLNRRYSSLYLEPNSHMADPFETDMSGLRLNASKTGKLVVTAVAPGSPAAQAHVEAGDVLLRMENQPLTAANLGSVVDALRSAPGATVHLVLESSGKPREATLRLKRML